MKVTLSDLVDLLINEDTAGELANVPGVDPNSLQQIKDRNHSDFASLQTDVEALLVAKPISNPNIALILRLAADEFEQERSASRTMKYAVKDGDAFGEQKVSLARRNHDGSLLFTNAYSGLLPEDFYRVSEIDDNLTPIYIHPSLELAKSQIPDLGAVSRFDFPPFSNARINKHKRLGISTMSAGE
ncbi:UNVERIFIED_CONTAM: hypothetical protein HDU68_002470 [Siphonaria sp. JEL0065]|nr:hypothetical protein HDU68_002470 [Siphonaria sp. JEL0065]